jgi:phosphatidylinositol kinase/protein kinase (PI-3  family)
VWSLFKCVVGRGDKHPETTLLTKHNRSLCTVTSDCKFSKAKTLAASETAPFRFIQNIIDAMPVVKADESFKNICELFMGTLNDKKQKPISLLNPFFCNQLLAWNDDLNKAEFTAKLTLKEIERRLHRFSEEHATITSSDCILRTLIPRATDTASLVMNCRGWQADVHVLHVLDVVSFGM